MSACRRLSECVCVRASTCVGVFVCAWIYICVYSICKLVCVQFKIAKQISGGMNWFNKQINE